MFVQKAVNILEIKANKEICGLVLKTTDAKRNSVNLISIVSIIWIPGELYTISQLIKTIKIKAFTFTLSFYSASL